MPVGWWTQGYAQRRTYSAHDTSYLAFPDEREQAELANTFFGGDLTDANRPIASRHHWSRLRCRRSSRPRRQVVEE